MKKDHVDIPLPSSRFHRLECDECNEEQVVYSHATTEVNCDQCGSPLAKPTGSKARLSGKIKGAADPAPESGLAELVSSSSSAK